MKYIIATMFIGLMMFSMVSARNYIPEPSFTTAKPQAVSPVQPSHHGHGNGNWAGCKTVLGSDGKKRAVEVHWTNTRGEDMSMTLHGKCKVMNIKTDTTAPVVCTLKMWDQCKY